MSIPPDDRRRFRMGNTGMSTQAVAILAVIVVLLVFFGMRHYPAGPADNGATNTTAVPSSTPPVTTP